MVKDTRKNLAYNYLHDAILTWKIPPGSPIVEQEISNQLGVSRTPVREALKLLEAEGLVKGIPQRGTFVSELSTQDVEEIFALREALEVLALHVAIRNISMEKLNEQKQRFSDYLSLNSPEIFCECDRSFHDLIVKNGGNERLSNFLDSINAQVERIRTISALETNRLEKSSNEHLAILQAIESGDVVKAEAELRRHIQNAKQSTMEVCRNRWWKNNAIVY